MIHATPAGPAVRRHCSGHRPDFEYHFRPAHAPRPANTLNPADVKSLIEQGLPSAHVEVQSHDNTHFEALVVSPEFDGKRPLVRHQMVYATLGERMGHEIHALSLRTLTPEERRRDGSRL